MIGPVRPPPAGQDSKMELLKMDTLGILLFKIMLIKNVAAQSDLDEGEQPRSF